MSASNNTDIIETTEYANMPEAPSAVEPSWFGFVPMLLIFGVVYFFLIRPQEKRRREHEEFTASAKRGEEIVTNGGLFGVITKINQSDDTILINIAKDTEVKIQKHAIADIVSRKKVENTKNTPKKK